jgi:transcriptional regulator with XRE-family HTH domain
MSEENIKSPHPVDIHVGMKLRSRRMMRGMSQEELGRAVGVTFQQIQKYERGDNRIGCSRLFEIASFLNVPIDSFFEGLSFVNKNNSAVIYANEESKSFEHDITNNKDLINLVKYYNSIKDIQVRKKIISLVKSLAFEANNKS